MSKGNGARLAKAYLDGLVRSWPRKGGPVRPSRDWGTAAFVYASLSALGASACTGAVIEDVPDSIAYDAAPDAAPDAASTDAQEPDALTDALGDEQPSAVAMYAAPGCSCVTSKGGAGGSQLWFGAAVLSWALMRRRR
ncbi:MAG: MYXO-CTERM sorting domain-containing protein [Myxococcota bacterium]